MSVKTKRYPGLRLEWAKPTPGFYIYDSDSLPIFDCKELYIFRGKVMIPGVCGHETEAIVMVPVAPKDMQGNNAQDFETMVQLEILPEIYEALDILIGIKKVSYQEPQQGVCADCAITPYIPASNDAANLPWELLNA